MGFSAKTLDMWVVVWYILAKESGCSMNFAFLAVSPWSIKQAMSKSAHF